MVKRSDLIEKDINEITEKVIGSAFSVSNSLGSGFLEKVYENAMVLEIRSQGLRVEQQYPLEVLYKGQCVGEYIADLYVEDSVIVELKAVKEISDLHKAQVLNYLRACNKTIGLLINFGNGKVAVKRIVNNI